MSWDSVREEIINNVNDYVYGVNLTSIDILQNEDDAIFIDLKYTVSKGESGDNKELIVKL